MGGGERRIGQANKGKKDQTEVMGGRGRIGEVNKGKTEEIKLK